ncbi:MAG: LD-carboxypeptidase [Bacteroidetes bacterium]|nr:LD-carboxypeptidase [Bacteroidota bacterium]
MRPPAYLREGDNIAIVAPAGKIAREKVEAAKTILQDWGLQVVLGSNLFKDLYQFSATDEERLADLQNVMDDPEIKAALFARGGYGVIRILDRIDLSGFRNSPKWLIGFSDITIFHSHIYSQFGMPTIHGPMAAGLTDPISAESLRNALFGKPLHYEIESHPLDRHGKARGILVGGNLSILCSLTGTASDIDTKEKILFIEDVGEYLYRIDRMMWQMKRAGKLEKLKGLIVGGMTDMKDSDTPFGKSPYEIVAEAVKDFGYPVCFGFPAGHQTNNRALIIGKRAELVVEERVTFLQK